MRSRNRLRGKATCSLSQSKVTHVVWSESQGVNTDNKKNDRKNMNDSVSVNSLCTENSGEQSGWASEPVRLLYGLRTDSEEQLLLTYWCLSNPYSSKNTVLLNKCPGIFYENILLCHKQKPTSVINTSL